MSSENKILKSYVGSYCLVKLINTGQSCQLWQAKNPKTGQLVALKRLLPDRRRVAEEIELLKQEYAVSSALKSKYCIAPVEFATDSRGDPFLALEWFQGVSLKKQLESGMKHLGWRLPAVIPQMISALADVHKKGFVHRDVKPSNFMINADNEVRLIDFAIALKVGFFASLFRGKQKIQGTRSYMSPEQIRALPSLDARADIYSLGCTFFELLSGRPPYVGGRDEVLQQHLTGKVPNVIEQNGNVAKPFNDIIRKMMSKLPENRFKSMAELQAALKDIKLFIHTPLKPLDN